MKTETKAQRDWRLARTWREHMSVTPHKFMQMYGNSDLMTFVDFVRDHCDHLDEQQQAALAVDLHGWAHV